MAAILILVAVILLMGIVLTLRGWRGVRVDDHPVCRRCGFDLVGLPDGVAKCSECGADLTLPRAVRIGNRHRRKPMLLIGVAMLVLPLAAGSIIATLVFRAADINRIKPVWWLRSEARDPATAAIAMGELDRRMKSGDLTDTQIASIVDVALEAQANATMPWIIAWGDFIDHAHSAGKVGGERWKKYAEHTFVPPILSARPEVRRGDDVPFRLQFSPQRCGTSPALIVESNPKPSGELFDPTQWHYGNSNMSVSPTGGGASTYLAPVDKTKVAAAAEGPHELHILMTCTIRDSLNNSTGPVLGVKNVDLPASWNLVSADKQTIKLIHDPGARDKIAGAITMEPIMEQYTPGYLQSNVDAKPLPYPVAFDVIATAGGKTWNLGSIEFSAGVQSVFGIGSNYREFPVDQVDVVLRSNPEIARKTVHMTEIWDGEIVIKNVPVKHRMPADGKGK